MSSVTSGVCRGVHVYLLYLHSFAEGFKYRYILYINSQVGWRHLEVQARHYVIDLFCALGVALAQRACHSVVLLWWLC
jgi:hypothetical protein